MDSYRVSAPITCQTARGALKVRLNGYIKTSWILVGVLLAAFDSSAAELSIAGRMQCSEKMGRFHNGGKGDPAHAYALNFNKVEKGKASFEMISPSTEEHLRMLSIPSSSTSLPSDRKTTRSLSSSANRLKSSALS